MWGVKWGVKQNVKQSDLSERVWNRQHRNSVFSIWDRGPVALSSQFFLDTLSGTFEWALSCSSEALLKSLAPHCCPQSPLQSSLIQTLSLTSPFSICEYAIHDGVQSPITMLLSMLLSAWPESLLSSFNPLSYEFPFCNSAPILPLTKSFYLNCKSHEKPLGWFLVPVSVWFLP